MRILITGGSGFVCLNIVQKLLKEGNDVFIYDKASLPSPILKEFQQLKGRLVVIQADIMSIDQLEKAITQNKITHFIHGAAITPTTEQERDTIQRVIQINFGGTMNVLECLKNHSNIPLIYLSSMAAAGQSLYEASSIPEAQLHFYPTSCYGIAKFASEQMIQEYSRLYDIRAVSLRLGVVFGPWEHPNSSRNLMSPALRIIQAFHRQKEVTFDRFSSEEWIYSKDVANYIYEFMRLNSYQHSSYCLVSGFHWSTQDLCERLRIDFPDCSYSICQTDKQADICYSSPFDHAVITDPYIFNEISYRPGYDLEYAYNDYTSWLKEHPDYLH